MEELSQKEAEIFDKIKRELEGSGNKIKKFQSLSDPLKKEILENFNLKLFYAIKTTFANFKLPKHLMEIVKFNRKSERAEGEFLFWDDKEIALVEKYAAALTLGQVKDLILIKRALKSGISDYNYFDKDLKEEILRNKTENFTKIIQKEFPELSNVEVIWDGGNLQIRKRID